MSRQKAGLQFEHDLANEVHELTGGSVIPLRGGWSGNGSVPSPDLLIPYKGSLRALEIKTSNQKRVVVDREDIQDIIEWSMQMTEVPTFPYLAIKFSYYEMQTFRIPKPWDLDEGLKIVAERCPYDSRVTRGGNISFGNPKHYDCDVIGANASPGDASALLRDFDADSVANVKDGSRDVIGVHEILKEHPNYWKH